MWDKTGYTYSTVEQQINAFCSWRTRLIACMTFGNGSTDWSAAIGDEGPTGKANFVIGEAGESSQRIDNVNKVCC